MRRAAWIVGSLVISCATASGTVSIDGPQAGVPGASYSFTLAQDGKTISADKWEQGYNLDRYTGIEYVSSFTLDIVDTPSGIALTAPCAGRYKIVAWMKGQAYAAYLLVRPPSFVAMRGAAFSNAGGPLDRDRAAVVLTQGKQVGMTWAHLFNTAFLDADSANAAIQVAHFAEVPGSMSFDDLQYVVTTAQTNGLKILLDPGVWVRDHGKVEEFQAYLGSGLTPAVLAQVLKAYADYMAAYAVFATSVKADQLIVGNNLPEDPGVGAFADSYWTPLLADLRSRFAGKLWFGWVFECSGVANFRNWDQVDGIHFPASLDVSSSGCQGSGHNVRNLTAEMMYRNLTDQRMGAMTPYQISRNSGLPVLWTDVFLNNIDDMSHLSAGVYQLPQSAVRTDNQEAVDYFEALARRATGIAAGFFPWAIDLSANSPRQDPLRQPALVSAIANWYGGALDISGCKAPLQGLAAAAEDYESSCPLPGAGSLFTDGSAVGTENGNPANHVLKLTRSSFLQIGDASWADYAIHQRVRLIGDTGAVVMFSVRRDPASGASYAIHFSLGNSLLWKQVGTGANFSQTLVQSKAGALKPSVWSQIEVQIQGARVTALLDGVMVHQWTDPQSPYLAGGLSVAQCCGAVDAVVEFDDFTLTPLPDTSVPAVGAVTDAASFRAGPVSPGEIVVIFGARMGPDALQQASFTAEGVLPAALSGTRVLFDGVAAPLLYVSAGQLSAIVPYGVAGRQSTSLVVDRGGTASRAVVLDVTDAAPGVFAVDASGTGPGAILDGDGTLNNSVHPAHPGSIVVLFLSGVGVTKPESVDGHLTPGLTELKNPIVVKIGGVAAEILYAGGAPGAVAGLYQVNASVPNGTRSGPRIPVEVYGGEYVSQPNLTIVVTEK